MASATFTAVSGGGTATYTDGNGLDYAGGGGAFCTKLIPGMAMGDIAQINSPGVAGSGTKTYQTFNNQDVTLEVVYIAGSENACIAAWQADALVIATVCTLVAGGVTYPATKATGGGADQPKSIPGTNNFRMDAKFSVKAVRQA